MNWIAFLDDLAAWLDRRKLLGREARWVVGVSGGPDSTLLLYALRAVSEQRQLFWRLHAAHLNHGLRGAEADADEHSVARLAADLDLPFHVERVDVRAHCAPPGSSTEDVARRLRYEFLERVALQTGGELVAVAHHADDNAETILHRICRGTGLRGLRGIADVRPIRPGSRVRLVRPLLTQRRATLEQLCHELNLPARTDSTNTSAAFTRNRIRHTILPMLRDTLNPKVSEALLRLGEQAQWLAGYLEEAAGRTFESLILDQAPERLALSIPALLAKHPAIATEVIRRAVATLAAGEQDLGLAHVQAVLRLAEHPDSGKELHLPGRVIARKQYDRLEFRPLGVQDESLPELAPVIVSVPGRTRLPALGAELLTELRDLSPGQASELLGRTQPGRQWLDYDQLRPPLLVRGRRAGDRFHPLGAPGVKSLSDFLIAQKIDPQLRRRLAILCDQDGPIWIIPWRIDHRARLTPNTRRALHLTFNSPAAGQVG